MQEDKEECKSLTRYSDFATCIFTNLVINYFSFSSAKFVVMKFEYCMLYIYLFLTHKNEFCIIPKNPPFSLSKRKKQCKNYKK